MPASMITLTAADGHRLQAWVAQPDQSPQGGIVVIQEIFGLTDYIRRVTEDFAAAGYLAIAPAMFDRVQPQQVLDYSDFQTARATMEKLQREDSIADMSAAAGWARQAGNVGIVGFCWGGAMADLAACHGLVDAGVSYYGRMTVEWLELQPACPMLYHYGATDPLIPSDTVAAISAARDGSVHIWEGADHGFSCPDRATYHPEAAHEAWQITLKFLTRHLN